MNQKLLVPLFLVPVFAVGCQNQSPSRQDNQNSNKITASSTTKTVSSSPENSANPDVQTINFTTPDSVKIVGSFYGANAANSPAVLMLHQFGANRTSFKDLARQFQADGIAVLAIDGRGFGESTKRTDGSKVPVSQSNEAVAGMKSDVAAAVKFLCEQKNVDKTRLGIVGASYGSSLAIIYAAENPEIKAVALLSPGTNYFGNLPTIPAIEKYGARPVLIVAAEDDEESATASRGLDKLAAGDLHQLQIYQKGGHGTGIFAARVGLDKLLLEFFQQNL